MRIWETVEKRTELASFLPDLLSGNRLVRKQETPFRSVSIRPLQGQPHANIQSTLSRSFTVWQMRHTRGQPAAADLWPWEQSEDGGGTVSQRKWCWWGIEGCLFFQWTRQKGTFQVER